eukprot:1140454-Pelagomonas_calceolata.AAC.3
MAAFDGGTRRALSMTSRPMRALVLRACTAFTVHPADYLQLQGMLDHLCQCCAQQLCLGRLFIEPFGSGSTSVTDLGSLAALTSLQKTLTAAACGAWLTWAALMLAAP